MSARPQNWLDDMMSRVDGVTGHKSTHYTDEETQAGMKQTAADNERISAAKQGEVMQNAPYQSFLGKTGGIGDPSIAAPDTMSPNDKVAVARAAMKRIADMSQTEAKVNDTAEMSRMGGKFTDKGLEQADKDSTANGLDRLKMKSMVLQARDVGNQRMVPRLGLGGTSFGSKPMAPPTSGPSGFRGRF